MPLKKLGSLDFISLIVLLIASVIAYRFTSNFISSQIDARFNIDVDKLARQLEGDIQGYKNILEGTRGLFVASDLVEPEEFQTYLSSVFNYNQDKFKGIYSIAFVREVTDEKLEDFAKNVTYELKVDTTKTTHYFVDYVYSNKSKSVVVFGEDLAKNETRRLVFEKARDTGRATIYGPIDLTIPGNPHGFVLTLPVYEYGSSTETLTQRRENLVGFILGVFVYKDFIESIIPTETYVDIHFAITDQGIEIFNNATDKDENGIQNLTHRTVVVADREWQIHAHRSINANFRAEESLPIVVLAVGVVGSFLVFSVIFALSSSQSKAIDLAAKMTVELQQEKANVEKKVALRTKELSQEKAKLAASIEALLKAYVMIDLEGNIILTNKNLEILFGKPEVTWTLAELQAKLGRTFDLVTAYRNCLTERKRTIYDDLSLGSRYLQIRLSPIFDNDENGQDLIGILVILGDVTEEKVQERSRDEFFSIASHELRTPLTAIKGNISLIKQIHGKELKNPDLVEMIDDMGESAERLINIVNDFLDMGRLEQGKMEFRFQKFNLKRLIQEALQEFTATQSMAALKLTFEEPQEDIPLVYADPDKTRGILTNLIGNAVKFTETGEVTISLKNTQDGVCVSVTDTGRGIPVTNQAFLFRKFQQAGGNLYTRDATKGTGLGLYISKLMVEGMGGTIRLESSIEGKGSTFSFTLPIAHS